MFSPTFFPEAHASWWQFKSLYLRSLIFFFFPKRKTLLGCHLLQMQPGGNESCKNENQTISYHAWEGQGRGTSLLCLAAFSLRVPSASSNSASDWLIPAPWELFSKSKINKQSCQSPQASSPVRGCLSWLGVSGDAQNRIFTAAHLVLNEVG